MIISPIGIIENKNTSDQKDENFLWPLILMNVLVPSVAVLQYRAVAPLVFIGFSSSLVMFMVRFKRFPCQRGVLLQPIYLLGLFGVLSAAWSPDSLRALGISLRFLVFIFLTFLLFACVSSQKNLKLERFQASLGIGLLLSASLLLTDHLSSNFIRATVRGLKEWGPALGHGLKPAVSIMVVALPALMASYKLPTTLRVFIGFLVLASAVLVPAQTAKFALLVMVVLWAAFYAGSSRKLIHNFLLVISIFIVICLPAFLAFLDVFRPNLEFLQRSGAHRMLIWLFVTEHIWQNPILGWGVEASRVIPGGTTNFSADYLKTFGLVSREAQEWFGSPSTQRLPLHPHNGVLQIWLELGIVGVLIFIFILIDLWLQVFRLKNIGVFAAITLVAVFVFWNLSYGIWQEWWIALMLWIGFYLGLLEFGKDCEIRL